MKKQVDASSYTTSRDTADHHRERIRKKFKQRPADNRIIALNIPDEYERGDPRLIELLKAKVEDRLAIILGVG